MFALVLRLRHWKPPSIVADALPPFLMRDGLGPGTLRRATVFFSRIKTTNDPFSSPGSYSGRPSHRVVLQRTHVDTPRTQKALTCYTSSEYPSLIYLKPCRTCKYSSPKSKIETADLRLSGSSSASGHDHCSLSPRTQMDDQSRNDSALGRYLTEEDAWKRFLVTGAANSNTKAQALARDSQHWDVALERTLPPKAWRNSKSSKDKSDRLPFANGACARES